MRTSRLRLLNTNTYSCWMVSRAAVFKLCVTALTLLGQITPYGGAAPTNQKRKKKKKDTKVIHNLWFT